MNYYKLVSVSEYQVGDRVVMRGRAIPVEAGSDEERQVINSRYFLRVSEQKAENINGITVFNGDVDEPAHVMPQNWANRRILVRCPGGLGDTLIMLNAISFLKERECHVTAAVDEKYLDLGQFYPIDECVEGKSINNIGFRRKFDIYISLQGVFLANSRELVAGDYYKEVFKVLGMGRCLEKGLVDPDLACLDHYDVRLSAGKNVFIHTEASNPLRRWHGWEELIKELGFGYNTVYVGGSENFDSFVGPCIENVHHLPLMHQFAIMRKCDYFIGVDSGFAHFAGQAGVPGVVLFGLTEPAHVTRRYKTLAWVHKRVCKCCRTILSECGHQHKCMKAILPADVLSVLPKHIETTKAVPVVEPDGKVEGRKQVGLKRPPLKEQPKLVCFLQRVGLGGGEVQTLRNALHLKKWFDLSFVWLSSTREKDDFLKEEFEALAPLVDVNKVNNLPAALAEADVILTHSPTREIYSAVRHLNQRPVLVRYIRSGARQDMETYLEYKDIVDAVICVDKVVAEQVGGTWLPSGIPEHTEVLQRIDWKFMHDIPIVGYAGRVGENKNVEFFVKNLRKWECNLVLRVDEQYHAELLEVCTAPERLRLEGFSSDMGPFYSSIDAIVLNSRYEGSPSTVIEAAAYGTPAISTDVGALKEMFGNAIYFFERNSVGQFGAQLTRLREFGKKKGDAAREKVRDRTPYNNSVQIRKVIRKAIGRRYGKVKTVLATRWSGAGDFIMSSAFFNRVRETFPGVELMIRTGELTYNMARLYGDKIIRADQEPSADLKFRMTYLNCWNYGEHAVKWLWGTKDEIYLPLPQIPEVEHPAVGIWGFQKTLSNRPNIKEWPLSRWKELVARLKKEGLHCYQLGALFEDKWNFLEDMRREEIVDAFAAVKAMDCLVTLESVGGHAANAVGTPGVVLFGKSASPEAIGYDTNINIVSTHDRCSCWGNFDIQTLPIGCKADCMLGISVDRVFNAVMKVWKENMDGKQ